MSRGFRLEGNMRARLDGFKPRAMAGMVAAANYVAPLAQEYMRSNAPWTDRTGAARNGLQTKVDVGADKVAIILFHSVAYGVFLEVRWSGKYGIIEESMAAAGPLFVEACGRMIFDE